MSSSITHDESLHDSGSSDGFSFGYHAKLLSDYSRISSDKKQKTKFSSRSTAENAESPILDNSTNKVERSTMQNDDKYKELYGDNKSDEVEEVKVPRMLKERAAEAKKNKKLYESQDGSTNSDVDSKETLKRRYLESKSGGNPNVDTSKKSYRSIFGSESDIASADSEIGSSNYSASQTESPTISRKNPNILTGEAQADYIHSQTLVPRVSGTSSDKLSAEDWAKGNKSTFFNLPLIWQRSLIIVFLLIIGGLIYKSEVNFVDEFGYDQKANIPSFVWITFNMDREQSALQNSEPEERPLIMTRIRMAQYYDALVKYRKDIKNPGAIGFEQLEEHGIDTYKFQTDGWDMPLEFNNIRGDFSVVSSGADRIMGSQDDIIYNIDGLKLPTENNNRGAQ